MSLEGYKPQVSSKNAADERFSALASDTSLVVDCKASDEAMLQKPTKSSNGRRSR
jgi:hypothetical protein